MRSVIQSICTFSTTLCFAFVLFLVVVFYLFIFLIFPLLLTVFSWSKCEANVALLTNKPHFNTQQWSNCFIAMTASNINFHSWVIKLQINQANHVFVCYQWPRLQSFNNMKWANACCFPRKHSRCLETASSRPQWGIEWALAEVSTMPHKLRLWAPEDCGLLIPTSVGYMEWKWTELTVRSKVQYWMHCEEHSLGILKFVKLKILLCYGMVTPWLTYQRFELWVIPLGTVCSYADLAEVAIKGSKWALNHLTMWRRGSIKLSCTYQKHTSKCVSLWVGALSHGFPGRRGRKRSPTRWWPSQNGHHQNDQVLVLQFYNPGLLPWVFIRRMKATSWT